MRLRRPLPELQTVQLPVCCLSCRLSYTTARLPTCEPHVTLSNHASAVASELATSRPDQIKMHKMAKTYAPGSEELDPAGRVSNRLSKQVPCSQLLCPHTSVIQSSLRTCCWSIQLHVPLTVAYNTPTSLLQTVACRLRLLGFRSCHLTENKIVVEGSTS